MHRYRFHLANGMYHNSLVRFKICLIRNYICGEIKSKIILKGRFARGERDK